LTEICRCSVDAKFGGVVYLHDITEDRVGATFGPSWPIGYLARPEPARHVLLTTVKWDRVNVNPDLGLAADRRERELTTSSWKRVVEGGARTCRFLNTHDSAWKVVDTLLQRDPLELHVIQRELERIRKACKKPRKLKQGRGFFAFLFGLFGSKVRVLSVG